MELNEMQLDGLREIANIGSGTAATALSSMLGRAVDLNVPKALALELADAVDAVGTPDADVTAVVLGVIGDLDATVVLLFDPTSAETICSLLGVDPADPEMALSALGEVGNILGSSYIGAMGQMAGLELEPSPPAAVSDMLGAIVATALAATAVDTDFALLLDSEMLVEDAECAFGVLFVPSSEGVGRLLTGLGLAEAG
ncbi:MAG TPA: chemotaxis protein CheC [Gaiellales bacterium]|nr:chemotaxis protein CheC [Gaiellales bacterium]